MFDLYTSVILIDILLLIITMTDVMINRLITREMKKRSVIACLLIAGASLGECVGVLTNGASAALIPLHRIAKVIEFCCAPAIGFAVARAYGYVKRPKLAGALVVFHAVFECVGVYFQWVFYIDSQNVYHRAGGYFIYVMMFVISIVHVIVCVIRSGKEYQTDVDIMLILTFLMSVLGITIQFVNSSIRIDFLCIAISNMLLYSRYSKMVLQVDAITRLLNRRCYDTNLSSIGSYAVILFFDVNRFKQVNDLYGHTTGDLCLKKVAEQLRTVYGKSGSCYRIGGDEFCVILNRNFDKLEQFNQQFLENIREEQKKDPRMPGVALGYAYYDSAISHIQHTIEEADEMMYQNKKAAIQSDI